MPIEKLLTPEEILDSARPFEMRSHYILMTYDPADQCLHMVKSEQLESLQGRLYVFAPAYEAPVLPSNSGSQTAID